MQKKAIVPVPSTMLYRFPSRGVDDVPACAISKKVYKLTPGVFDCCVISDADLSGCDTDGWYRGPAEAMEAKPAPKVEPPAPVVEEAKEKKPEPPAQVISGGRPEVRVRSPWAKKSSRVAENSDEITADVLPKGLSLKEEKPSEE